MFFTAMYASVLVLLTISGANSKLAGPNCSLGTAATPFPVRLAVTVVVVKSANVIGKPMLPVRVPVADGVKVTFIWQEPVFAATVVPLHPSYPPWVADAENSPGPLTPTTVLTPVTVATLNGRFP
jgi:hypothetical protein